MAADLGMDPVEHLLGRIKSEDSMREKCRRKGLPETPDSALIQIHDAIGIRVVCAFLDDIYTIRDRLLTLPLTGQAGLPLGGLVALAMVGGSSFGLWQHRSSRTKLS